MSNIKISVIIPVYNVENYLKKCLDSIMNQTLKDIEIICINDGSTDSSLNILEEFANNDSRIRIINQKNKGPGATRNLGVKEACGEYLGFVDADDWIESNYFETLYNAAKEIDADISRTMVKKHYNNDYSFNCLYNLEKYSSLFQQKQQIISKDVSVFTKIFKKKFIIDNKIQFGDKRGEDIPFTFFAVFYAQNIADTNSTCYNYLLRDNSLMRRKNTKWDIAILEEYKKICDFLNLQQISCYNKQINEKLIEEQYNIYPKLGTLDKKIFLKKYKAMFPYVNIVINTNDSNILKIFLHNIFSIRNDNIHKVITICGVKLKLKNKKLIKEIQLHDFIDSKFKALESHLEEIKLQNEELRRGLIFNNLLSHKDWIKDKDIIPAKGFANYSLLYILLVILDKIQPENILEFGFGQTTKLTTQYEKFFKKTDSSNTSNGQNIVNKKYDLIIIGSSSGSDKIQTINILDLIPQNLAGDFIIILDDVQSELEQNTAQLIFEKLDENNIKYSKFCCGNAKSQLVITSDKYKFLTLC